MAYDWRHGLPILRGHSVTLREPTLADADALYARLTTPRAKASRSAATKASRWLLPRRGRWCTAAAGYIGFGELIIVKHSDRMLSAYAHNRRRLVVEGQRVAAGEQLAEMGRNDRNQPMLHFDIRVNGAPQDPLKYLPRR